MCISKRYCVSKTMNLLLLIIELTRINKQNINLTEEEEEEEAVLASSSFEEEEEALASSY